MATAPLGPVDRRKAGILLRQYRRVRNMSQEALAERAGISTRTITGLESGKLHRPRKETLELLAEALELSAQQRAHFVAMGEQDQPFGSAAGAQTQAGTLRNLPRPATELVGREQEIAEASTLLLLPEVRLLTLVGPPGAGKTWLGITLARSVAGQFSDGVRWVPLVSVTDVAKVPAVMAPSLRIGEREEQTSWHGLIARLRVKQMLLLLDNFEHLLAAAQALEELVTACPRIKVLVTSRSALHLPNECLYHIQPLS